MHRFRPRSQRRCDDHLTPQVAVGRARPADVHRLIRHRHMARVCVSVGIHRHTAHPHGACGFDHPAGNFAPVGYQDFLEHHSHPCVGAFARSADPVPRPMSSTSSAPATDIAVTTANTDGSPPCVLAYRSTFSPIQSGITHLTSGTSQSASPQLGRSGRRRG